MVAMNEVADTTQVRSIPVIDPKAYLNYYKNFEKWMLRKPNPGEVPSKAQLTCLIEILKSGTCYVDLAIFGEHQCRSAVAMKCSGRAIGPGGVIQPMVFRGPDCYTSFRAGWDVYNASMTMLEECIPQWIEQYGNRIRDYDKLFGPKMWAFLYQSHVRFWSEHMPGPMLMKANDQLDALVAHNPDYKPVDGPNGINYNPAKPWAWLFRLAADTQSPTTSEWAWWHTNFERIANLIACNAQSVDAHLGGDAPVASDPRQHFASHPAVEFHEPPVYSRPPKATRSGDKPQGGGKKHGGGGGKPQGGGKATSKGGKHQGGGGVVHTLNKKFMPLCVAFQSGHCPLKKGKKNGFDINCPKHKDRRHQCNLCLAFDHGAYKCNA